MLSQRRVDDAGAVAEVAVDALTEWPTIETGAFCRCSCHPCLPDSDRHDYGFDCICTRNREQPRESFQRVLNGIDEYWQSPEGEQIQVANQSAEAGTLRGTDMISPSLAFAAEILVKCY